MLICMLKELHFFVREYKYPSDPKTQNPKILLKMFSYTELSFVVVRRKLHLSVIVFRLLTASLMLLTI